LAKRFVIETSAQHVDNITDEVILAWRDLIVERSSTTTCNTCHRHLGALLDFCIEENLIQENPLSRIRIFSRANNRRKGCSLEELEKLCDFLEDDAGPLSPIAPTMVQMLFHAGMRRSQLCSLIWHDLDFHEDTLLPGKQHSKNGREWRIALHDVLRPKLFEMKQNAMLGFPDFSENDQVFWIQRYSRAYADEKLTPQQFAGILRRASRRSGTGTSAHKIRHLVATTPASKDTGDFHETGAVPYTLNGIGDFPGHENITTTVGYIEPGISIQ